MSKQSNKKQRHSSLMDVPFTQRTAHFKQDIQADPYRTLPSKEVFRNMIYQNENLPLQNKFINQYDCNRINQQKMVSSIKMGQKKSSVKKTINSCLNQIAKIGITVNDNDNLEKKIETIIEKKLKKLIQNSVERYLSKFLDDQKDYLNRCWQVNEKQINSKLKKIEKGYDDILLTYDNFLNIVQRIKDKSFKNQKYVKKAQFQSASKKTEDNMADVLGKLENITHQLQNLKKAQPPLCLEQSKIKPILLNYESNELGLQELRVVVNTYNQNFLQIDQKLQEIYSYFT